MKKRIFSISGYSIILFFLLIANNIVGQKTYYVTKKGTDTNNGSKKEPFLTISKAAALAQPGDTILVYEGTYREYINPPTGGVENKRITYKVAAGNIVYVKGSERINNWKKLDNGVWEVKIPNTFFGSYNPYALNVDGDFQTFGQWHHRGDVYLNNKVYDEQKTEEEMIAKEGTWYTKVTNEQTIIKANFGTNNPNDNLTEINVRELLFFPSALGVDYITIDGFRFLHAAPNWQAPNIGDSDPNPITQVGAIGSKMGKGWIIENCEVSYSKTAGIMLGESNERDKDYQKIEEFGNHIVRNNIITRCGEYGIAGQKGLSRSLIEGNLIENINYRKQFGGWETAAIKVWNTVDLTIKNNVVRNVFGLTQTTQAAAHGIWIDFGNQGTRITSNILYNMDGGIIYLEANFGPALVDNNIIYGRFNNFGLISHSYGTILAHNLFIDCQYQYGVQYEGESPRKTIYFIPHSMRIANFIDEENKYNKTFNNIFLGIPKEKFIHPDASGGIGSKSIFNISYQAEGDTMCNNLYIDGTNPPASSNFSLASKFKSEESIQDWANGVSIQFQMDSSFRKLNCTLLTSDFFGFFPVPNQKMEDKFGLPITINTDIKGATRNRNHPTVGPFEDLQTGNYLFTWKSKLIPTGNLKD